MLDLFRNRGLSSLVMGALIATFVLIFVVQFNPSAGKTSAEVFGRCAANVRGKCVSPKDFFATYKVLMSGMGKARAKSMNLSDMVLDGLVERQLLIDEAQRLGITVSDDEVTDSIFNGYMRVSLPSDKHEVGASIGINDGMIWTRTGPMQFFHNAKTHDFDDKVYERYIAQLAEDQKHPFGKTDFREWQEAELLAQKMRNLVESPVRVSDVEAMESYLGERSSATVTHVELNPSFAIAFGDEPKDSEVDAWTKDPVHGKEIEATVASRKDDPSGPKAGHYRHILIKVAPTASVGEKMAAIEKLTRAVARIKHGETFSEVAKDVSMDDGSKPQGGDVGEKTDGFVLPFKTAADALKPGEMTAQAIETQFGYHVILKDDPSRLAKEVARENFVRAHAGEWAKNAADKILAAVKDGKSVDDATKLAVASVKPFPLLTIAHDPSIAAPSVSDAGVHTKGDAGLAMGDAGNAPVLPTNLIPEADSSAPHAITSSSFNHGSDPIPALGTSDSAKLIDFAFGTAKEGTPMSEVLRGGDAYFVVVLKEHKQATPEEFKKDRDTYVATLLVRKQSEALGVYVRRLTDEAKKRGDIKKDETFLLQFHSDAGTTDVEDEEP